MTGYRNTPPHQRPTTPQPTSHEHRYRTAAERQDETRPRIEQTGAGRDLAGPGRTDREGRTMSHQEHGRGGDDAYSVHTCHDECPCHTGGEPTRDFIHVRRLPPAHADRVNPTCNVCKPYLGDPCVCGWEHL